MAHICVVDDKEILRDSVREVLAREDHRVVTFGDATEALAAIKTDGFDLIVTDLKMPRLDGLGLIREVRASGNDAPIVMMTAFATVSTAVEAMKLGAYDYIQKPFDADALAVLVDRALDHARLRKENEALRASVADLRGSRELIGSGSVMVKLKAELDRIAVSQATVLITGESGTGKELVAHYLHTRSVRAERPMLCLNCAALSAGLLESELFGHERGAFTGADRTRKGRFELADGGTLLLDEVSEMALPLQAKMLRVLQEGEFERVGSSTTRRSDVRVIATTNRNLEDFVAAGGFREDLYYRLNVLPVSVPALRQRADDIPELVSHFLRKAARCDGAAEPRVAPAVMRHLVDYAWPGNVRELENLCRRAVTLCTNGTMTAEHIDPWLSSRRRTTTGDDGFGSIRDGHLLEDIERQLIEKTLTRFNGHRADSAKALGMGVRTLSMKLKQWRDETAREKELAGMVT